MKEYFPAEFDIAVGGCFGPTFTVRLVGSELFYEKSPGVYALAEPEHIEPKAESWAAFWQRIEIIGTWDWEPFYEGQEKDGAHWYVHMKIGDRSITSEGDGAYPEEQSPCVSKAFESFMSAVRDLLGGRELW